MTKFELIIRDFIEQKHLLDMNKRYVVALSGGADSVCLLVVLLRLGYQVEAAHCNFHLRGDESDRDEAFCEALCMSKNIPFHRVHFDTRAYAELHRVSIEMAARDLRYNYFHQLLESIDAEGVCIAHHKDDVAETMLINLVRGTGLHGLTGIASSRNGIIRPLLCVSRDEIVKYLGFIGQDYVTDSSNHDTDIIRNKIRHEVMPVLRQISPAVTSQMVRTADRLASASVLFDECLESKIKAATVSTVHSVSTYRIAQLLENEYILYGTLSPFGFGASQVEQIYENLMSVHSGMEWRNDSHTVITHRDRLVVYRNDDGRLANNSRPHKMPVPGLYNFEALGLFKVSLTDRNDDFEVDRRPTVACMDADQVAFPLCLRHAELCDRFAPYGMRGTKLVSDYLTDLKRSLYEKRCQMVLTDEMGEIVWLVGERISQRAAVTAQTTRILMVEKL